jgi:ectoine hydroxylase-related dioxygenase (phytanoyl-CoA dioxygenase family)
MPGSFDITPEDLETFDRDGLVCLRGVVTPEWVDVLRAGVERDLNAPGENVEVYTKPGDPGYFFNDFDLWTHIPQMKDFALNGPCAEIAGRLMMSRHVNLFFDHLFVKEPGTPGKTHWHQDQPYFAVNGAKVCSNWIPLDPVSFDNGFEFIPGSHKWGRWFAPFDSMSDGSRHQGKEFERCPDIENDRDAYKICSFDMNPGDVLFFHSLVVHQGRSNPRSAQRRRALAHRWLGDDAHYVKRDPPSEFPKIPASVQPGQSFRDVPEFPLVWSEGA